MPSTAQCPQEGKEGSDSDSETPGPAAAPATVTNTVVSSTLMTNSGTEAEKNMCWCHLPLYTSRRNVYESHPSAVKENKEGGEDEEAGPSQAHFQCCYKAITYSDNECVFIHAYAGFHF